MPMTTMVPVPITSAQIVSSDAVYPAAGEALWLVGSSYDTGDTVSHLISHPFGDYYHLFESKIDSNVGNIPEARPNENASWIDRGSVNETAMFFNLDSFQTTSPSPFVVEILPGDRVGAVSFSNIDADNLTVEILDGATVIHTESVDLLDKPSTDAYEYSYMPWRQIEKTAVFNLPMAVAYGVRFTFTRGSGYVGVGNTVIGTPFEIGSVQYGAKISDLNFSTRKRDPFGFVTFTPRLSVPDNKFKVRIKKHKVNAVRSIIKDLNAVVTMFAGLGDPEDGYFESTFLIGFYEDPEISLDHPDDAFLNITLKGI